MVRDVIRCGEDTDAETCTATEDQCRAESSVCRYSRPPQHPSPLSVSQEYDSSPGHWRRWPDSWRKSSNSPWEIVSLRSTRPDKILDMCAYSLEHGSSLHAAFILEHIFVWSFDTEPKSHEYNLILAAFRSPKNKSGSPKVSVAGEALLMKIPLRGVFRCRKGVTLAA